MSLEISSNIPNTQYIQNSQSAQKSSYKKYAREFITNALATGTVLAGAVAIKSFIESKSPLPPTGLQMAGKYFNKSCIVIGASLLGINIGFSPVAIADTVLPNTCKPESVINGIGMCACLAGIYYTNSFLLNLE